jgi:hypothetical protein
MWREHAGLSVTDGSQKQAMMESICSAFVSGARPSGPFMNKFRKLGFISYNGKIEVNSSLLNAILYDKPEIKSEP